MGTATQFTGLATVDSSAYEWSDDFLNGQPQAYRAQNIPYVTACSNLQGLPELPSSSSQHPRTVNELIKKFLSVMGDTESPHGPSTYQSLELEAFCATGSLDILEEGLDYRVNQSLALLDDRSRLSNNPIQVSIAGSRRRSAGPLSASRLLQELRKKRYECDDEPNAGRRLLYVTNPDCWVVMALATTASREQALFLAEFFYKYLGFKTSLGIHRPPRGIALFALEFHLSFYVWREGDCLLEDSRKKRNDKPLRRSRELHDLDIEESQPSLNAYIYEAQISCLVTGLDHDSWLAYLFIDTYYQGDSSYESVEHYHSHTDIQPDPLMAGTLDADLPIWTPREYFLAVYECRLKQVRHAFHNLVSRLLLKLEPYIQDSASLTPVPATDGHLSHCRKKKIQKMLNEASRVLKQTIHSISKAIEVWDRFSSRDAAYLSDILRPRGNRTDTIPPFRVVAMIGDHINGLRDLQRRAEEQQDLCAGLARELEMQLIMEDNENTADQQKTGYWMMILAVLGVVVLPFQATTSLFNMQPGILPPAAYTRTIFVVCWLSLTFLIVMIGILLRLVPLRMPRLKEEQCISQDRLLQMRSRFTLGSTASLAARSFPREDAYELSSLIGSNDLGAGQTPRDILD